LTEVSGREKVMILGVNGVGVARYGLILWENDATGSRKVFKYLPGLREAITKPKNTKHIKIKISDIFILWVFLMVAARRNM